MDSDQQLYAMPGNAAGVLPPSSFGPGSGGDIGTMLQVLQAAGLVPSQTAANLAVDMTTPAPAAPTPAPAAPLPMAALQAMLGNGLTPSAQPAADQSPATSVPVTPGNGGGLAALTAMLGGNTPAAPTIGQGGSTYTPDQVQAQFFDKDGKFLPVADGLTTHAEMEAAAKAQDFTTSTFNAAFRTLRDERKIIKGPNGTWSLPDPFLAQEYADAENALLAKTGEAVTLVLNKAPNQSSKPT